MIHSVVRSWSDEPYVPSWHSNTVNSIIDSWTHHHDIEPLPLDVFGPSILLGEQRRLKAVWSREAAEDLRAFHDIDAEAELAKILVEEINREIQENRFH